MLDRFRPYAPVLFVVAAMGCYNYSDVSRSDLVAGRQVRLTLSSEGRQVMASRIGTGVRSVMGRLRGFDTASVTIAVTSTTLVDNSDATWNDELVTFPFRAIDVTQERTLSKGRTLGMMAIVAGLATGVTIAVSKGAGSSNGTSVPSTPAK